MYASNNPVQFKLNGIILLLQEEFIGLLSGRFKYF